MMRKKGEGDVGICYVGFSVFYDSIPEGRASAVRVCMLNYAKVKLVCVCAYAHCKERT